MEKDFDKENGCFVAGVRKVYTLIELKKKRFLCGERERERESKKVEKKKKNDSFSFASE